MSEQYNQKGELYHQRQREFFTDKIDVAREFIYARLPKNRNAHIIDMGCGRGSDVIELRARGYTNVFGVDPSDRSIEAARDLSGQVDWFVRGTYEKNSLPSASVDHVFGRYSFGNVLDTVTAYKELARILKPKGKIVIVVGHPKADALEDATERGGTTYITVPLYGQTMHVEIPLHTLEEYLPSEFSQWFEIEELAEFQTPDRIPKRSDIAGDLAIVATRK